MLLAQTLKYFFVELVMKPFTPYLYENFIVLMWSSFVSSDLDWNVRGQLLGILGLARNSHSASLTFFLFFVLEDAF
jgi:hypothetical protein